MIKCMCKFGCLSKYFSEYLYSFLHISICLYVCLCALVCIAHAKVYDHMSFLFVCGGGCFCVFAQRGQQKLIALLGERFIRV